MSLLLTAILAGFILLLGNLALLFLVKRRIDREKRGFIALISSYFAPQGVNRDQPSELAGLISFSADQVAQKTAQSLKLVFMGQNSVVSKNAARVTTALGNDVIAQQNPLLGLAAKQFPELGKLIANNPGALRMLSSFAGGGKPPGQSEPDNGDTYTQELSKYT